MDSSFVLTAHAIEQLITRYDRTLGHEDAKLLLETAIAESVTRLPERTYSGEDQWHVPGLGIVLVTKRRRDKNIVVTVVREGHINAVREQQRVDDLAATQPTPAIRVTEDGLVNTLTLEVQMDFTSTLGNPQIAHSKVLEHAQSRLRALVNDTKSSKHVQIKDVGVKVK